MKVTENQGCLFYMLAQVRVQLLPFTIDYYNFKLIFGWIFSVNGSASIFLFPVKGLGSSVLFHTRLSNMVDQHSCQCCTI